MPEIFLKIRNLSSKGTRPGSLSDVSLDVGCGECLAVSGHTYSGIKELYAVLCKNSEYTGHILLKNGKELKDCRSSYDAGMLYIDPRVMRSADRKTLLHSLSAISGQGRLLRPVNDAQTAARFTALLEKLDYRDCELDLKDSFYDLPQFEKIQFAVLRCLYASAGCIVLENPFQGLRDEEIDRLIELLAVAKKHGTALVYLSDEHFARMEKLIDRVAVLRHGAVTYMFSPEGSVRRFDRMRIDLAAGGKTEERKGLVLPPRSGGTPMLTIGRGGNRFDFLRGECVGVYDPEMKIPSEYTLLAEYLNDCEVILNGKYERLYGLKDFLSRSVVLIRKDPSRELFKNLSPVENVAILSGRKVNRVFSRRRIERYLYREVCKRYSYLKSCLAIMNRQNCYQVSDLDLKCLVVAKWLSLDPQIVVFFDIEDTYQPAEQEESRDLVRQLSQEGILVITVSPNLDFLEKISDRIIR